MSLPLPTVTVLIPCYNTALYLHDTVRSVLAQTLSPLEILLIDDGSTDGTRAIIDDLARDHACIRAIALPHNQGVVAARNAGLAVARGDYIAMLDGDDLWLPDALAMRVDLAVRHPEADLIATDFAWFDSEVPAQPTGRIGLGPRGRAAFAHSFATQEAVVLAQPFEVMARTHFVWVGATLVKRAAIAAVGNFAPDFDGPEDTLLWLRLAQRGQFVFSPRITSLYRQRPGSLVTLLKGPKELHYIKVLDRLGKRAEFAPYRAVIDDLSGESHLIASQHYSRQGQARAACRHALRALSHCPTQPRLWRNLVSVGLGAVRPSKP